MNLAKTVAKQPGPPIDLNTMADMFLQRNMVREATAFLLEVLQDNDPQHDKLQTKVSEPLFRVQGLRAAHQMASRLPRLLCCQMRINFLKGIQMEVMRSSPDWKNAMCGRHAAWWHELCILSCCADTSFALRSCSRST